MHDSKSHTNDPYVPVDGLTDTTGTYGTKPKIKLPQEWKKIQDQEAMQLGLQNKYQASALREYLWSNGKHTVVPVIHHRSISHHMITIIMVSRPIMGHRYNSFRLEVTAIV